MGANFKQTAQYLGVTDDNPFFVVNNEVISHFFDTPHIIKAVRNNFHDNIIEYDSKPISWECVNYLFQQDKTRQFRLAPKLSDKHIKFSNFERMKVNLATQILSSTVSSSLRKMVGSGDFKPADAEIALRTAEFIQNANEREREREITLIYLILQFNIHHNFNKLFGVRNIN